MFNLLKVRINHGFQAIKDIKKAQINKMHRGFPVIENIKCKNNCKDCIELCPTNAITNKPLSIDLGKCIFCGDCERGCENKIIRFTNFHKISTTKRESLIINSAIDQNVFLKNAFKIKKEINKIFGKYLKLREVSAGGCNSCEMELNACSNVNFDMGRFGIEFVASPRHADGIVITGPITENMASALEDTYLAVPHPKIIILAGTCAISKGIFDDSNALNRAFIDKYKPDLYVPGCPVHPLTFINGLLDFLNI
jgi:Ni,Fe-hydrogenase III small subunit/NAD-dependent dihydropyrimidine dehydrogenase PreA subunit